MIAQKSWQILFTQALTHTSVDVSSGEKCSFLAVYEYIYRAINLAGINNRPPLGWHQIFAIWWQSRGDAETIKLNCIQAIQNMQKPVYGYRSNSMIVVLLSFCLTAISLLPQTANTFKTTNNLQSILRIKPLPMEDIDTLELTLPSSSDYIYAANQFLGKPVLYDRIHGVYGTDWIKSQQDDDYSLQLISTSTRDAAFEFCQQHNICSKTALYSTQINGKTYYRLLYSQFNSRSTAQLERSNLPLALQQLKPWARNFKQIKSEI